MTCALFFYLLTAALMGFLGAKLARHYGQPWPLGSVIGVVFHLPGLLVLWLALALLGGPKGV